MAARATRAAKLRNQANADAATRLMKAPVLLDKIYRRLMQDPCNQHRCTQSMAAAMSSLDAESQKSVGFFMRFHFLQLVLHCAVRLYVDDRHGNNLDDIRRIPAKAKSFREDDDDTPFDRASLRINTSIGSSSSDNRLVITPKAKIPRTPKANGIPGTPQEEEEEFDSQYVEGLMANAVSRLHQAVLLPLLQQRPRFFQRDAWRKNVLYVKEIDLVLSRYSSALKVGGYRV